MRLTDARGRVLVTTADGKTRAAPPVYLPFILAEGDFVRTAVQRYGGDRLSGGTAGSIGAQQRRAFNPSVRCRDIELGLRERYPCWRGCNSKKAMGTNFVW